MNTVTNLAIDAANFIYYDMCSLVMGLTGLGFMIVESGKNIFNSLLLTSLLEWIVGLSGIMSSAIKLSADFAANFG